MTFDLFSPAVRRNPYPYYAELRHHSPVHFFPQHGFWTVSRYAEVTNVLRQPNVFSSAGAASFEDTLLGADPPAHTRVHKIVANVFSPQRLAGLEEKIRTQAQQAVNQIIRAGQGDLMQDLAIPLPIAVIAELLGIDPERRDDLKNWSDAIVAAGSGMLNAPEQQRVGAVLEQFHAFFVTHIEQYLNHTDQSIIRNWLCGNEKGEKLTPEEAINIGKLLLIAGNETTSNLIGNTVMALLQHPQELALVQSHPQLIPAMLEEALRYDPPAQMVRRRTTKAVELNGVEIPADASVSVLLGSANRDENKFPTPDRFLIERHPQGHVAFGFGPHACIGAHLALLEARLVFQTLLPHLPRLHSLIPLEEIEWLDSPIVRGPKRLEVRLVS